MRKLKYQLLDFYHLHHLPLDEPSQRNAHFHLALLMEEVGELAQAVNKRKSHKHVETELADVLYVVVGMAISLGINLEKAFDEVHAKNMLKAEAKMNGGE